MAPPIWVQKWLRRYGPAGRVFDDEELKQLHGGVGQASHPVASTKMARCSGSSARSPRTCQLLIPSLFVRGPNLLNPGNARSGWNGDAVRVAHRSGEVGWGGRIVADGHHVDVSGGSDEARVDSEFRAKERLVRNSVTDCRGPIRRVVLWPSASSRRWSEKSCGGRTRQGLLGEGKEDGGMGREDGVTQKWRHNALCQRCG